MTLTGGQSACAFEPERMRTPLLNWFHSADGQTRKCGSRNNSNNSKMPEPWGSADVLLHIFIGEAR